MCPTSITKAKYGARKAERMFQLGNRLWHTDSSFKRLPAARASLLYARSIPPVGGHTEFADERAAYDALPEETKRRLEALVANRSTWRPMAAVSLACPSTRAARSSMNLSRTQ